MNNKNSDGNWNWIIAIVLAIIAFFVWLSFNKKNEEKSNSEKDFEERMKLIQEKKELQTEKSILEKHNNKIDLIQSVLNGMVERAYKRTIFFLGMLSVAINITVFFVFADYDFGWFVNFNAAVVILLIGFEYAIYRKIKGAYKRVKKEVKKTIYRRYFQYRTPEYFSNQKDMNWQRMQVIENEILEIDDKLKSYERK